MSGGISATTVLAAAAAAGTAYSVYSGERAAGEQKTAMRKADAAAKTQADLADQATNKTNAKKPDVGAMLSANQAAAKAGGSGTMLTGPTGVDPASLQLGKNTLLGA